VHPGLEGAEEPSRGGQDAALRDTAQHDHGKVGRSGHFRREDIFFKERNIVDVEEVGC